MLTEKLNDAQAEMTQVFQTLQAQGALRLVEHQRIGQQQDRLVEELHCTAWMLADASVRRQVAPPPCVKWPQ